MTMKGTVFQYYLFNNHKRTFAEIKDGSICGRYDGEIQYPSDTLMSRKHCRFYVVGNEVYVEDLKATNSTKVNTVPIQPLKRRRIRLNDVIEVGGQRFILTNQTKHAPSNIQDATRIKKYKALRKAD